MATTVNVGTAENSGNGDRLRDAMIKLNNRLEAISAQFSSRGNWATATTYSAATRDYVLQGGFYYVALSDHVSGVFATDLAAGRWAQGDALALRGELDSQDGTTRVGHLTSGGAAIAWADLKAYLDAVGYTSPMNFMTDPQRADVLLAAPLLDHTAAINDALATGMPLWWGNYNYRHTGQLLGNYTDKNAQWVGEGARVLYAGAHRETAVQINVLRGHVNIGGVTFDGGLLCNKVLEILANTTTMTDARDCILKGVRVSRAKRLNIFSGGNGVLIRGGFERVDVDADCAVENCELPAGQGTAGTIGITGLGVTFYSTSAYAKRLHFGGAIKKVYSSDLAYTSDQDGLTFFAPVDAAGPLRDTICVIGSGASFANNYGRSVKTQCETTVIEDGVTVLRDEGSTAGVGNGEFDAQYGSLIAGHVVCAYFNGKQPGTVFNSSSDAGYGSPELRITGGHVALDAATTLDSFASCFPRAGGFGHHIVQDFEIDGKCKKPVTLLCNGNKNYLTVRRADVKEFVEPSAGHGKALVWVQSSGTGPYFADVIVDQCKTVDVTLPSVARANVPGVSTDARVQARGNTGFAQDITAQANPSGLKILQTEAHAVVTPEPLGGQVQTGHSGYMEVSVAAGITQSFSLRNIQVARVEVVVGAAVTDRCEFMCNSTTTSAIGTIGTGFGLGTNAEPGAGNFRAWTGVNEVFIKNNTGTSRAVSVKYWSVG